MKLESLMLIRDHLIPDTRDNLVNNSEQSDK